LSGKLDDGVYIWIKEAKTPQKIHYAIGYNPKREVISFLKVENGQMIALSQVKGEVYIIEALYGGVLVAQQFLDKEKAYELAYQFFREMVSEQLV